MTAPQQTPGGQREDTALATGALIGAIMTAAETAMLGLLVPALARVLRGGNRLLLGRRLHAQSAAILDAALGHADTVLAAAERTVIGQTVGSLNAAIPDRAAFTPPLAMPTASSWSAIERQLRDAGLNILRDQDDVWRRSVEAALSTGGEGAAQRVLDDLAEHGLTAYVDKAGRHWTIGAYSEMAVRTAASRLALAVQMQAMAGKGLDLAVVDKTSVEQGCPKCRPFEYRVLSISGLHRTGTAVSIVDGTRALRIDHVKATLAEAVAAGLLHPSCRHFLIPWVDGMVMTTPLPSARNDGPSYREQQKQRAAEREHRQAATARSLSLTPLAKARANRRLVEARSARNLHAADYHLPRQRTSEPPVRVR